MFDKFKHLLADDALFYGALIVLSALISFGLGRWSVSAQTGGYSQLIAPQAALLPETTMHMDTSVPKAAAAASTTKQDASQRYVASKNGSKYHLLSCPGAAQIKKENKIYFDTKEAAQKAGYTPASNCPGI